MNSGMNGGSVVWITGLSGAGKTTVATLLAERLTAAGTTPVRLDGDRLREIVPAPAGYAEADRRRMAMFYARLAHQLAAQGHLVICSTVSLFHDVQAWNRTHTPRLLRGMAQRPPSPTCATARDGKPSTPPKKPNAYATSWESTPQPSSPRHPDLVIDNYAPPPPPAQAAQPHPDGPDRTPAHTHPLTGGAQPGRPRGQQRPRGRPGLPACSRDFTAPAPRVNGSRSTGRCRCPGRPLNTSPAGAGRAPVFPGPPPLLTRPATLRRSRRRPRSRPGRWPWGGSTRR
ncbi:hypothetical protein GCM10020000_84730 [Streptomyces olivoverticillatus]